MKNIVIKFAGSFVDVFSGQEGWDEHTRFQMVKGHNKKKRLAFISGKTLTNSEFNHVKERALA